MPRRMPAKGKKRGPARKRLPRRRLALKRSPRGHVPEYASCSETDRLAPMNTGQAYSMYNVQLSAFPRARVIAQGYQFYRIKTVRVVFKPLTDTFIAAGGVPGATSTPAVPYLYYMIDRGKQFETLNTADKFRALGCVPRRLDEKNIVCSYKPSVLNAALDNAPPVGQISTQFVQYKVSPWLSCRDNGTTSVWNPDSTDHLGLLWIADNIGTNIPFAAERIVEFEFKKPAMNFTLAEGEEGAKPIFPDLDDGAASTRLVV